MIMHHNTPEDATDAMAVRNNDSNDAYAASNTIDRMSMINRVQLRY